MQNNSKSFSSVAKVISSSNMFLSSYGLKIFEKDATIYKNCDIGVTFVTL